MKIKIFRKRILKENCGGPVEPLPNMEAEPAGDVDINSMTPENAYEEGRRVAMEEMQATLASLMAPSVPTEIEVAVPDQHELEEDAESAVHGHHTNK